MKVILFGAEGQMGRTIKSLFEEDRKDVEILSVDRDSSAENLEPADIAMDFSSKDALSTVLDYCIKHKVPLVMGTTGQDEKDMENIHEASKVIPLFYSGNFSLGIYLLKEAIREVSKALGGDADIEIMEKHHRKKKDAPSGTALILYNALQEGSEEHKLVYGREGESLRSSGEVGMHSVRGGTIVGEHTVLFAMDHETLEFTHRGESRRLFAKGAIKAVDYIRDRRPGLYGMDDLMKGRTE